MTDANEIPQDAASDVQPVLKVGDTVGSYQIVSLLSAAETCVVWRAQHTQTGADAMVRELIPGSPMSRERSFLERCQKEIDKQGKLGESGRRVVLLKELIDDPRGAFLVSDYAGGASIEQLLNSRPDPFDLVRGLRIVHSTAKVLSQLHKLGMIHGGLRPSNIVLRLSGGVQVVDAGVTGLIAEQEALSPDAARYMAPELFHGVAGDARSDIYALGIIAYEMLAGRGAFEHVFNAVIGDKRNSAMRWMKWHTNARVQAPHLHELNPRVPVRLSDLISRMMAKDRSKRIASGEQLLEAIQRHFGQDAIVKAEASPDAFTPSGAQIKATGPGDTTELPQPSKKPMVIGIAAAVVVVLSLGVWFTVSTINKNAYEHKRSLAASSLADADVAYRAGRFADAISLYEAQATAWTEPGDELALHGKVGALIAKAQIALSENRYDEARSLTTDLEMLAEAGPASREAVKALSDEVDRRQAFDNTVAEVQTHLEAGEFAQARNVIKEAQRNELTENESKALLDFQVRIDAELEREQVDEALATADEMVEQNNVSGAINHLSGVKRRLQNPRIDEKIESLTVLKSFRELVAGGESAERSADYDKAIQSFEEAIALMEDDSLSSRIQILKSKAAMTKGRALVESGDEAGAQAAFTNALAFDPNNAEARGWLARMNVTIEKRSYIEAGKRAEASGDLLQAASHYRAALQSGPDEQVQSALNRVEAGAALAQAEQLIAQGQLERAGEVLDEAKELQPDSPAVAEAMERHARHVRYRELLKQGDGYAEQGRYAQAKQAFRSARDVMKTEEIEQRLDDTEFNHLLAQARGYIANEQWPSARGILSTAAKIRVTDELTALREQVTKGLAESKDREGGEDG